MSRALFILRNEVERARASNLCHSAQLNTRVEFKAPKRTLPQNDKMWAMLSEISRQVDWFGSKLPAEDWKLLFLNGLERYLGHHVGSRIVPSIDLQGYVYLGASSSKLSKDEMAQLIELIYEFGARHFVKFKDDKEW